MVGGGGNAVGPLACDRYETKVVLPGYELCPYPDDVSLIETGDSAFVKILKIVWTHTVMTAQYVNFIANRSWRCPLELVMFPKPPLVTFAAGWPK